MLSEGNISKEELKFLLKDQAFQRMQQRGKLLGVFVILTVMQYGLGVCAWIYYFRKKPQEKPLKTGEKLDLAFIPPAGATHFTSFLSFTIAMYLIHITF